MKPWGTHCCYSWRVDRGTSFGLNNTMRFGIELEEASSHGRDCVYLLLFRASQKSWMIPGIKRVAKPEDQLWTFRCGLPDIQQTLSMLSKHILRIC